MVIRKILRWYAKWRYLNRVDAKEGEFTSWSGTHRVYWYSDENDISIGKLIPDKSLMLNKSRMDNLSPNTRKSVVEHEVGHQKRSLRTYLLYIGIAVLIGKGLVEFLQLLAGKISFSWFIIALAIVSLSGLVLEIIVILRWEELMADLHALDQSSEDIFREAQREFAQQRPQNRITLVKRKLFYTKPDCVVNFHQFLDRHGLRRFVVR